MATWVLQHGIKPFERAAAIDTGASLTRSISTLDVCMTITKTEAARRGFWCTYKGGFMSIADICRLQGYPDWMVPWQAWHISEHQAGMMLGNAMTLPVVMAVLPQLLYSADKINALQFDILKARGLMFSSECNQ